MCTLNKYTENLNTINDKLLRNCLEIAVLSQIDEPINLLAENLKKAIYLLLKQYFS